MWQVFRGANVKLGNWRQVTVPNKIRISRIEYLNGQRTGKNTPCKNVANATHTEECTVTACRTGMKSTKRRRLFLWQVK